MISNFARVLGAVALISLFVASTHAQVVRQITDTKTGDTSLAAIDDGGSTLFAVSSTDPLGTNARHAFQIFKWDQNTA